MIKSSRVLLKSGVIVRHGRMAGIARFRKEAEVGQLQSFCQGNAFRVRCSLLQNRMSDQQQHQQEVHSSESEECA